MELDLDEALEAAENEILFLKQEIADLECLQDKVEDLENELEDFKDAPPDLKGVEKVKYTPQRNRNIFRSSNLFPLCYHPGLIVDVESVYIYSVLDESWIRVQR